MQGIDRLTIELLQLRNKQKDAINTTAYAHALELGKLQGIELVLEKIESIGKETK